MWWNIFQTGNNGNVCDGSENWLEDALFEDYTGPQMINRPSYPEFNVQFKTLLCPFLWWGEGDEGEERIFKTKY